MSKRKLGFRAIPSLSAITLQSCCFFLYFTSLKALSISSSTIGSSFSKSSRSRMKPLPIFDAMSDDSSGLHRPSQRLCVMPFVLFVNFSGNTVYQSRSMSFLSISVCIFATPLTYVETYVTSRTILMQSFVIMRILPRCSSDTPLARSSSSSLSSILTIMSYISGITPLKSFVSHFSSASLITVWFVYENVALAVSSAETKSMPFSISILMSSGTETAGCVSFSCIAACAAKHVKSSPRTRLYLLTIS